MDRNIEPTGALAEILAKTGELDRILDGRGLTFEPARQQGPTPPPPQPLLIMPADWEPEVREDFQSTPAQPRSWRAEQLRGDGS